MIHRFGEFSIDTATRELRRGGVTIDVEPRAYELLAYLIDKGDRAVGKDELQDDVSGTIVADSAVALA